MRIAIEVAGFSAGRVGRLPAGDGHVALHARRWRSSTRGSSTAASRSAGCRRGDAEELFAQVAGFASFGFAKSHAAAFARTAYESAFLKLFYPAQFVVGLDQRPADGLLPGGGARQRRQAPRGGGPAGGRQRVRHRTTTEWAGGPAGRSRAAGDDEPTCPGEPLRARRDRRRPRPVRSPPAWSRPRRRASAGRGGRRGWGVRLGLHLVKGIGEEHAARLDAERRARPVPSLADVVARTGLPEEVLERLIRAGRARFAGSAAARAPLAAARGGPARQAATAGGGGRVAGRPLDLRLPATPAPDLPPPTRAGAAGRRLRDPVAGRAAPGGRALPAGAGPAGGGDQRGARGAPARAGARSAAWSSPASTR